MIHLESLQWGVASQSAGFGQHRKAESDGTPSGTSLSSDMWFVTFCFSASGAEEASLSWVSFL